MRYYEDEYILPKLASKRPTLYVSTQEPGRTWTGRIESSNLIYFLVHLLKLKYLPPPGTYIFCSQSSQTQKPYAQTKVASILQIWRAMRQKQVQRVLPKIFQLAATGCPFWLKIFGYVQMKTLLHILKQMSLKKIGSYAMS